MVLLELPGRRADVEELYRQRQATARQGTAPIYDVILLLLMGEKEKARQHALWLKADLPRIPGRTAWYAKLNDYYAGAISEEQFLNEIGTSRWNQSDGFFAIGLMHLLDGDRTGAEAYFRRAMTYKISFEGTWSDAFLSNMKNPDWPQWLVKSRQGHGQPATSPDSEVLRKAR
jgi:hypothetical protein